MKPITILATALGFVLVQLDVSIVNVALASIGKQLHAGVAELQWIVDAYTVAFAACLLGAGSLADRIGARRAFALGFVTFGCSSIACALAPAAPALIAARAVQGLGAALLVPCSLALLNHAAAGDAGVRARAVGWWTASGSVALAAGPLAGGIIVEHGGWRDIFFVNVPLCALALWLTFRFVDETRPSGGSFDLPGQLTSATALATLTAAVISASSGGWSPLSAALVAVAAVSGTLFVVIESRRSNPMLPLEYFRRRSFTVTTLVGLGINFTLYGALFVLGLSFQRAAGYSPLQTGFAFLPLCVSVGIANLVCGRLVAARGARLPMAAGLLLAALGYAAALVPGGARAPYVALLPALVAFPFGIGLAVPAMTSALLADVETERSGLASGVLNTVRQAGGALGVAVLGGFLGANGTAGWILCFAVSAAVAAATGVLAWCALPKTPA